MVHIANEQLRSMSTENIEDLLVKFKNELDRRNNEKREELVKNFQKAFFDLLDHNINIQYSTCEEEFYITNFASFTFS